MWLAAAIALAGACGDDGHPPAAPDYDGGRVSPPPGSRTGRDGGPDGGPDAGDAGAALDAGVIDCVHVPSGDEANALTVEQPGATEPFVLESAYVMWNDLDCEDPRLLIGLTDGSCLPGVGQQLLFAVDRDAVGASVVVGANVLSLEPTPLRVQFSRPSATSRDVRDVFGTCAAGTEGTIDFVAVGTETGASETASFEAVQLAPCTEPLDQPSVTVTGSFDLTLPVAFEAVCP